MVVMISSSVTILVIQGTIPGLISTNYHFGNGSPDFQLSYHFGNQENHSWSDFHQLPFW